MLNRGFVDVHQYAVAVVPYYYAYVSVIWRNAFSVSHHALRVVVVLVVTVVGLGLVFFARKC